MKKLIKSYSFWTALAGALAVLASAIGRAFSVKIEEKIISDIVMAFAGVLVAFGLVKLPTADSSNENSKKEEGE